MARPRPATERCRGPPPPEGTAARGGAAAGGGGRDWRGDAAGGAHHQTGRTHQRGRYRRGGATEGRELRTCRGQGGARARALWIAADACLPLPQCLYISQTARGAALGADRGPITSPAPPSAPLGLSSMGQFGEEIGSLVAVGCGSLRATRGHRKDPRPGSKPRAFHGPPPEPERSSRSSFRRPARPRPGASPPRVPETASASSSPALAPGRAVWDDASNVKIGTRESAQDRGPRRWNDQRIGP